MLSLLVRLHLHKSMPSVALCDGILQHLYHQITSSGALCTQAIIFQLFSNFANNIYMLTIAQQFIALLWYG